jgi:hypothetical protein
LRLFPLLLQFLPIQTRFQATIPDMLNLDFNIDAGRQIQAHQHVNRF